MRRWYGERNKVLAHGVATLSLALAVSMTLASCSGGSGNGAGGDTAQESEAVAGAGAENGTDAQATTEDEKPSTFDNWTSSSSDKPVDWKWSVTEVGSFEGEKNDVKSNYNRVPLDTDGTHLRAIDGSLALDGAELDSQNCAALYGDEVVYCVAAAGDEPNRYGLVTAEGEVLIDFEAAAFGLYPNAFGQMRYLLVGYAGNDEDDLSMKVYDLKSHAFVSGVEVKDKNAEFDNLGDTFAITEGDKITLYDESGSVVWSDESGISEAGPDCISFSPNRRWSIVDTSGNVTFTAETDDILSDIMSESSGYNSFPKSSYWAYKKKGEDGYIIIDSKGNQAVEGTYDIVYGEADGFFGVETMDGEQAVVNMNGDVVVSGSTSVKRSIPGYTSSVNGLYHGSEKLAESSIGDLIVKEGDGYLVLSTGKKLSLDAVGNLSIGLVKGRGDGDSYYGVWDLITGEQVLDSNYESIEAAGVGSYVDGTCYLYAYSQGTWTVFEAKRVPA